MTLDDLTYLTSVKLTRIGSEIAAIGGMFRSAANRHVAPESYIVCELQERLTEAQRVIETYQHKVAEEASVEIVQPEEHQLDIEDGVASFEAYKAKMEAV